VIHRPCASTLALLLSAALALAAGPFTRQPLGQALWSGSVADAGRGGAGLALVDSTRIGERNPAGLHAGRLTRFQIGFSVARSTLDDGMTTETLSGGRFGSWALAFPLLWQELSLGLNLRPLTEMDFHSGLRSTDAQGRELVASLDGSGGLSQASLVLARAWAQDRLRVGIEAGLLFGSVLEDWKVYYPAAAPPYDSWVQRRQSLSGFRGRLGLLWQAAPGLSAGLVVAPALAADYRVDLENRGNGVDGERLRRRVHQPGALEAGLSIHRLGLRTSLDLALFDWSGLEDIAGEGLVERPWAVAAGLELPRQDDFLAPWLRRASWRCGLRLERHSGNWNAAAGGGSADWHDLQTWTFSLGAGLPLRSAGTWLDLALELGRTGDQGELGLEERFWRLNAGLTAQDLWFQRPKY
jgi:hypothetical protein